MAISFDIKGRDWCRCSFERWTPDMDGKKVGDIIEYTCSNCGEKLTAEVVRRKLTQGMYGTEFGPTSKFMGLRCGQMRTKQITHNSGWYNGDGEKIGWGDLDREDFYRIQSSLEPGDIFVILGEGDSFWKFVDKIGLIGSMCSVQPIVDAPGKIYCAAHAMFIITPDKFFVRSYSHNGPDESPCRDDNGMTWWHMSYDTSFKLMGLEYSYEKYKEALR
jgi:hypothetical protein